MNSTSELAQACLHRIVDLWQIDANRMKWLEANDGTSYGFEWWPGDYRVLVEATIARNGSVNGVIKLTARTNFLRQIDANSEKFETFVGTFARFTTSTYGWVYSPRSVSSHFGSSPNSAELWLQGSVYINDQNAEWLTDFFANTSIIQPINAQIQGPQMPSIAGSGVPNMARPITLGALPLDDILEVVAQVYAPIGQEASRFAGHDEFEKFAETYARNDNCFGNGSPSGMTLETPFGSDSALIRLKTDETHPQLGSGLLVTLQLPYSGDALSMARQAAELNFLETIAWTDFPQLGSWHTAQNRGSDEGLAFTLFVPSALYKPMLATNIAFWFMHRAHWARKTLYPEMQDLKITQILARRSGSVDNG
jgi:hypothetical protein